jgi:hypothetical protein
MDDVAKLVIEIVDGLPHGGWEITRNEAQRTAVNNALKKIADLAKGISPIASGTLRAFKCVDSLYWQNKSMGPAKELAPLSAEVPSSLAAIANASWRVIGGGDSPERAEAIIAAARVEFVRSHFYTVAMSVAFTDNPDLVRKELSERARTELETIDWEDADRISRNPWPAWGYGTDCTATDFNEWLWNDTNERSEVQAFNEREPFSGVLSKPSTYSDAAQCALHAIMLTWIDEAVFSPPHAIKLLAETADASDLSGCRRGWGMHDEYVKEESAGMVQQTVTDLARHAANIRHAPARANAKALRDAYIAGSYSSKDAAAEALCRRFNLSFRAARDHLKGI